MFIPALTKCLLTLKEVERRGAENEPSAFNAVLEGL